MKKRSIWKVFLLQLWWLSALYCWLYITGKPVRAKLLNNWFSVVVLCHMLEKLVVSPVFHFICPHCLYAYPLDLSY